MRRGKRRADYMSQLE